MTEAIWQNIPERFQVEIMQPALDSTKMWKDKEAANILYYGLRDYTELQIQIDTFLASR